MPNSPGSFTGPITASFDFIYYALAIHTFILRKGFTSRSFKIPIKTTRRTLFTVNDEYRTRAKISNGPLP